MQRKSAEPSSPVDVVVELLLEKKNCMHNIFIGLNFADVPLISPGFHGLTNFGRSASRH